MPGHSDDDNDDDDNAKSKKAKSKTTKRKTTNNDNDNDLESSGEQQKKQTKVSSSSPPSNNKKAETAVTDDRANSLQPFIVGQQRRTSLLKSVEIAKKLVSNEAQFHALLAILNEEANIETALEEAISEDLKNKKRAAEAAARLRKKDAKEKQRGVEVMVFIDRLLNTISDDDWERFKLIVDSGQEDSVFRGQRKTRDEMKRSIEDLLNKVDEITEIDAGIENVQNSILEKDHYRNYASYRPPFQLQAINDDWVEKEEDVLKFLESTTNDIFNPESSNGLSLPEINHKFVEVEPEDPYFRFLDSRQYDKARAIVVTGESGSGKTVYSCLAAKYCGFQVLYCALQPEDFGSDKRYPQHVHTEWGGFIKDMIDHLKSQEEYPNRFSDLLYEIKFKLDTSCNARASAVAERALNRVVSGDKRIMRWFRGQFHPSNRPEKVAIVIDNATDQFFALGMVDIVRNFLAQHHDITRGEIALIIAGTGLDGVFFEEVRPMGTNPSKSKLIVVKGPRIEKIVAAAPRQGHTKDVFQESIEAGFLSRILSRNTRMFCCGVLPIMLLPIFSRDLVIDRSEAESRLKDRLMEVDSFGPLMDYAIHHFVSNNSISDLEKETRSMLLKQAFLFHLLKSMIDVLSCMEDSALKTTLTRELQHVSTFEPCKQPLTENEDINFKKVLDDKDVMSEPDKFSKLVSVGDIFVTGLASVKATSRALKYLSCYGLTDCRWEGFGKTFEGTVAIHIARYAEIQGYEPVLHRLKHVWLEMPSNSNDKIADFVLDDVKQKLEKSMYKDEEDSEASTSFSGKKCLILLQDATKTQGPYIFAVYIGENSALLDVIYCNHFQKSPDAENMKNWWSSVGIDFDVNKTATEDPKFGSALRDGLDSLLKMKVSIGRRIIATSLEASSLGDQLVIPECGTVWCKELLEPTISVLQPPNLSCMEDDTTE